MKIIMFSTLDYVSSGKDLNDKFSKDNNLSPSKFKHKVTKSGAGYLKYIL